MTIVNDTEKTMHKLNLQIQDITTEQGVCKLTVLSNKKIFNRN